MKMNLSRALVLVFLLMVQVACGGDCEDEDYPPTSLQVTVFNSAMNAPVGGALVKMVSDGDVVPRRSQVTDSQGIAKFLDLADARWKIAASKNGKSTQIIDWWYLRDKSCGEMLSLKIMANLDP